MRKPSDLPCCPGPLTYSDFEVWRSEAKAFEDMSFGNAGSITFRVGDGRPIDMAIQRVSANAFGLLGVSPVLGRDFLPADEVSGAPPVVILSYPFWENRFAKRPDIAGTTVHVNGEPATIVGVMPKGFVLVYDQDLWMPLVHRPGVEGRAVGRLRDGATLSQARAELETINRRLEAADPVTIRGIPIVGTYAQRHVAPDAPMIYGSLWVGAWFVLLIACANVANLTLARTLGRWREFTTRIALGAGLGRMTRQVVLEVFLLAGVAAALGWWIINWSVPTWAAATATQYLALDYSVNFSTLVYLVAISVGAGVLVSLAPVVRFLQLGTSRVLKSEARGATQGPGGKRLGAVLVASQMALAMVLLSGTGVLGRSFLKIVTAETGVRDPDHVLVGYIRLPSDRYPRPETRLQYFDRLDAQLRTISGIQDASVSNTIPTRAVYPGGIEIEGRPSAPESTETAQWLVAGSDYFRVMGTSALSGRVFNQGDRGAGLPVAIVNQSLAAAFWPGEEALGKRLRPTAGPKPGEWRTVVGVVPNIMQGDSTRQVFKPVVYLPLPQLPLPNAFLLVRTSVPPIQLAPTVRAEIQKLDPDVTLADFSTLNTEFGFNRDWMDLEHAELRKHATVAPIYAVIALLLAAIGLVAVITHSVSQRTKEIGVRIAIGAAARDILRMVLHEGMWPVGVGLVVGLAGSLAVNRVLQTQLVGVSPYDPITMGGAIVGLTVLALIAIQIPARRAARVDPMVALRCE